MAARMLGSSGSAGGTKRCGAMYGASTGAGWAPRTIISLRSNILLLPGDSQPMVTGRPLSHRRGLILYSDVSSRGQLDRRPKTTHGFKFCFQWAAYDLAT